MYNLIGFDIHTHETITSVKIVKWYPLPLEVSVCLLGILTQPPATIDLHFITNLESP